MIEVNVRGVYNFIQCVHTHHYEIFWRLTVLLRSFSVPELVKTGGQIIILSSDAAQYRAALYSEYCLSKHTLHRLAEFVVVGAFPTS